MAKKKYPIAGAEEVKKAIKNFKPLTPEDYYELITKLPEIAVITWNNPYVMHTNPLSYMPPEYETLPYFDLIITYKGGKQICFEHIKKEQLKDVYDSLTKSSIDKAFDIAFRVLYDVHPATFEDAKRNLL